MREEFKVAENTVVVFDKIENILGVLEDTCEVVETKEDGHQVKYPYLPPLKANTSTRQSPIIADSTLKFDFDDALEIYEEHKTRN
jgi:hypothetical protein